eukprot:473514-Pleurochrysis_carterae.AAC.1
MEREKGREGVRKEGRERGGAMASEERDGEGESARAGKREEEEGEQGWREGRWRDMSLRQDAQACRVKTGKPHTQQPSRARAAAPLSASERAAAEPQELLEDERARLSAMRAEVLDEAATAAEVELAAANAAANAAIAA